MDMVQFIMPIRIWWRAGQIAQFTDYGIYQSTGVASGESSYNLQLKIVVMSVYRLIPHERFSTLIKMLELLVF